MTAISTLHNDPAAHVIEARFRAAMDRLGPFETAPHIAVAVSGGADSSALAILCRDWADAAGGRVTALVVDHRLRPDSEAEAQTTAGRLRSMGMDVEVLTWTSPRPESGLQAAAREARYGLLRRWCRATGVLHLVCGHHVDDQLETHLMRRARGEGPGNAGMSALLEFSDVRLLRPLLGVHRRDIETYLRSRGIAWIEDPSNHHDGFERVRLRKRLRNEERLGGEALAGLSAAAEARMSGERAVSQAMARAVALDPRGFAWVERQALRPLTLDLAALLVGRLSQCLGGSEHAPPQARSRRLADRLMADGEFSGASLGRCRFVAEKSGRVLVCRDARGLPSAIPAKAGRMANWDGRFDVDLPADLGSGMTLAPLRPDGWRQLSKEYRGETGLTLATARTLPALFDGDKLVGGVPGSGESGQILRFRPKNSLAFNGFCIA